MERKSHYGTVTEALKAFREQGFNHDFNLEFDHISCDAGTFHAEDFEIVDLYRYEGNSDPGDESVVYAIQSKSGEKGVLVTGYGTSADEASEEILQKLGSAH